MLAFGDFVNIYYNKKRRSGLLWTVNSISEDTGLPVADIQVYLNYCDSHKGLTDPQLIALDPIVQATPFGVRLLDRSSGAPSTSTLRQDILDVLAKHGL